MAAINASVIQGSALGPPTFAIVASDLHPIHNSNELLKYADDMYLIVSASNSNTVSMELDHIADWASKNNLCLNNSKTHEFVVFKSKRQKAISPAPPPINGINQVQSIKILGITLCNDLSITTHIAIRRPAALRVCLP